MSKRHKGGRVTPKGTRPPGSASGSHSHRPTREPSLIDQIARHLRDRSPLGLLTLASSVIETTTERPLDRWEHSTKKSQGPELFDTFVDAATSESEALARAVAAIHPDELLSRRLRDRIEAQGSVLRHPPVWLDSMGKIEVTDVAEMVHILDDGDNVFIGWRWPNGSAATFVVYIDHNMGTVVKDAFVMPESFDSLMIKFHRTGLQDQVIRPLDAADARARIVDAIAHGEIVLPPLETDTWPICRPMLEWILRALPEGGHTYPRPEWTDDQRSELAYEFATSSFGKTLGLSINETMHLADPLVWFACDFGPGDPLRWSPVSVEIVLDDWYPRKVFGLEPELMERVPEVLEAFVKFAHDRKQIPAYLTDETVGAVKQWTPGYFASAMRPGRSPRDSAVRRARIASGLDPGDEEWEEDDALVDSFLDQEFLDEMEQHLVKQAGGIEAYESLNDDPIPDEPFDWSVVPEQRHVEVAATLARLDELTTDLCDIETCTVARRVLAALVRDSEAPKVANDPNRLAAAIIWVICRQWVIGRTSLGFKFRTQKELSAATGLSTHAIGSWASTRTAVGESDFEWSKSMHSAIRRQLMRSRAFIAEARRDLLGD